MHPYPACFVCGPTRDEGDGLRIFPGPVEGRELYAAPWTPDDSVADDEGIVRPEFVWAALDCPSGIVTDLFGDVGRILLGRLAAELIEPLEAGTQLRRHRLADRPRRPQARHRLGAAHGRR